MTLRWALQEMHEWHEFLGALVREITTNKHERETGGRESGE